LVKYGTPETVIMFNIIVIRVQYALLMAASW
jgi:hypothetical protein